MPRAYDIQRTKAKEKNWRRVQKMWLDGKTMKQIAKRLGWSVGQVQVQMSYMRAAGWDLPRRHKPGAMPPKGRTPRKHGRPRGR